MSKHMSMAEKLIEAIGSHTFVLNYPENSSQS